MDEETVKLRLHDFYGQSNLSEVELAIHAFREENPTHAKIPFPWYWVIAYFFLVFQFRVSDHYNEVKIRVAEEGLRAAKETIVRMIYRQYQIFTDYTVEEDWSVYHIEMVMTWCLHYHEPQTALLSEDLRMVWSKMMKIFELKNDGSESAPSDSSQDENEQLMGADIVATSAIAQSLWNRIIRNSTKTEFLEIELPSSELPNIGRVNRTEILKHILSTAEREIPRFTRFFKEVSKQRVLQVLEDGLSPAVRRICGEGLFDIKSLKDIRLVGEDPANSRHAGVYMHILSLLENPLIFWLYIGQSITLKDRVRLHESRRRPSLHASLHYFIWNTARPKDSDFVTLYTAYHDDFRPDHRQLLLNLAEMWMCCVFQTLSAVHLEKYLPADSQKPWAGCHLNVALPLFQSFTATDENEAVTRQTFEALLQSTDPEIRQWAESLRDAYNQLRNSPDPNLRRYWDQQMRYSMDQAAVAQQAKSIANMQEYLSGSSCKVKFGRKWLNGYWNISTAVTCGQFTFAIPQGLGLSFEKGDEVMVQFHLADSEHPEKYVRDAQKTDPASRLAVSISGRDKNGSFQAWLSVEKAHKTLCKIITLVDILEGYGYDERRKLNLPRRWYTDSVTSKKYHYT